MSKNLTEMTRDELKAHVREKGWDEGADPIKLNSSTEEIRELCIAAAAKASSTAETIPPPPGALGAQDAPDAPNTAEGPAEGEGAPPAGVQGQESGLPADAALAQGAEVVSMTIFALRFGKYSLAELSAMETEDLRALCNSLAEVLTDEEVEQLDAEYHERKEKGTKLTMEDVLSLAKKLGRDPELLDPPAVDESVLAAEPAPVRHYKVEWYSRWVRDGVVYQLNAGCHVSSMSHPIDELVAQGVPLVEVETPDDSDPGIGHRFT